MKSTNIILTGKQQIELRVEDVRDPDPGEVRIRSRVSLISTGTESFCYRGEMDSDSHWADWVKYPFNIGYSNVGEVAEVGQDVDALHVGDRVFSVWPHHQFYTREASQCVKIPDGVSDEAAAWAKLASIAQTAVRRAELCMGTSAVVIGLGPLGQLVTQYLRVIGAADVLAIDTVSARLETAHAHGATAVFEGTAAAANEFVLEHTAGRLADVVFDVTGHYAVFPTALPLARQYGTVMLLGDSPHPTKQHLTRDVLTRQLRILGTHNEQLSGEQMEWDSMRQRRLFFTYLERKQMRVDDLITHRHSVNEAPDVYANLLADRSATLGVIFDWSDMG